MFTAGVDATYMSFLTSGTMLYERMHMYWERSHNQSSRPEIVRANEDWIAEPVLWLSNWCHLGNLWSETATELVQVHPDKLSAVAKDNPVVFSMFSSYSKQYVKWLAQFSKQFLSDITNMEHAKQDLANVVHGISTDLDLKARSPGYRRSWS
mmetsp:Transcript_83547/g.130394  ORF Transcript_83547/g.130394 Transcript_83547/m.130394 type:complete len:152 (+) Transcript_83547:2-457(+)